MNKFFLNASLPVATKETKSRPLFHKAITRAKAYSGPTQDENDDHNSVILHLPFQSKQSRIFPYPGRMANTCRQTSMESAPGTHEKPQNKREMHTSHQNLRPTQFPNPTSITTLFCPTNPRVKKRLSNFYFDFLYSTFFFLPPPRVS